MFYSQHQSEKQYECIYCHNKFKNKNEAERHQNSIHRRTSSWSCAVLANNSALAFFPSTSLPPSGISPHQQQPPQPPNVVAPFDICGYCGEEFTNEPQNWEQRQQHLLTKHKFGECNQSKKFYRADHFRQHLKHSHGGKSGKHTNSLEQACAREETPQLGTDNSPMTPPGQVASAPVANMGNLGAAGAMGHAPIGQPDVSQPHIQQQLNQRSNMGPPMMQVDMSNIDPNINYIPPSHHQQAVQIQGPGRGGDVYGYKAEDV